MLTAFLGILLLCSVALNVYLYLKPNHKVSSDVATLQDAKDIYEAVSALDEKIENLTDAFLSGNIALSNNSGNGHNSEPDENESFIMWASGNQSENPKANRQVAVAETPVVEPAKEPSIQGRNHRVMTEEQRKAWGADMKARRLAKSNEAKQ